jgi:hypothetical protein
MAQIVSTGAYYHYVRRISAYSNSSGVLNLTLSGDEGVSNHQFNMAEITVFTEDKELVDRLVAAINGCAPQTAAPELEELEA